MLLLKFGEAGDGRCDGPATLVHLLDDPLYIALAPTHPLATRARLRLPELARPGLDPGDPPRLHDRRAAAACRAAGFEPRITVRMDDQVTVHGLVAAGVGIALVPQLTVPAVRPTW